MNPSRIRTVFDVITDFLATRPSPEDIIAYHLPDDLQAHLDDLLSRNTEDLLSEVEHAELVEFVSVDEMFSLLKAKMLLQRQEAAL